MFKRFLLVSAFLSVGLPAFADVQCTSGNLASLIGTTCDIGQLRFTFTGWHAVNEVYSNHYSPPGAQISSVPAENIVYYASGPSADNFTFTALSNGFTISGRSPLITGTTRVSRP